MIRRIWVKRPGLSPTMIKIDEDFLVDDVRDLILQKYQNSLGRNFDAPDIAIRILPREKSQRSPSEIDRVLLPDEPIARTIDIYYPNGQTSDEALLIDIPVRKTPKASPAAIAYYPGEGPDYFSAQPTPNSGHLTTQGGHYFVQPIPHTTHPHSISVLTTGHLPPLPVSPGGTNRVQRRPKTRSVQTSSPILLSKETTSSTYPIQQARSHGESISSEVRSPPMPPPLPTSPIAEPGERERHVLATTPPARTASPRPKPSKKASKKADANRLPLGLLDNSVPPINVLIVEDNMINLRLLEAMVKRLKIRWSSAVNGKQAVDKWREGGFHLVLMDIQLPVMNGLEATKEIRRLERVNEIGIFTNTTAPGDTVKEELGDGDKLSNSMHFKSPVIIVALTASSLQSDRHEALAAGCNDFLTKVCPIYNTTCITNEQQPVRFDWLERKVLEWGCMQAMIDFSGWRKWREFANRGVEAGSTGAALLNGKAVKAGA
jgi:osomolarity two-component system response regulator SSK1